MIGILAPVASDNEGSVLSEGGKESARSAFKPKGLPAVGVAGSPKTHAETIACSIGKSMGERESVGHGLAPKGNPRYYLRVVRVHS